MKAIDALVTICTGSTMFLAPAHLQARDSQKPPPPKSPQFGEIMHIGNVEGELTCVWTVDYAYVKKDESTGQRGTFGLLITDPSKDETTKARFIIVQLTDL